MARARAVRGSGSSLYPDWNGLVVTLQYHIIQRLYNTGMSFQVFSVMISYQYLLRYFQPGRKEDTRAAVPVPSRPARAA